MADKGRVASKRLTQDELLKHIEVSVERSVTKALADIPTRQEVEVMIDKAVTQAQAKHNTEMSDIRNELLVMAKLINEQNSQQALANQKVESFVDHVTALLDARDEQLKANGRRIGVVEADNLKQAQAISVVENSVKHDRRTTESLFDNLHTSIFGNGTNDELTLKGFIERKVEFVNSNVITLIEKTDKIAQEAMGRSDEMQTRLSVIETKMARNDRVRLFIASAAKRVTRLPKWALIGGALSGGGIGTVAADVLDLIDWFKL